MRIGLRGGHSPYAVGAVGLRKEYECMQELYKYTEAVLKKYGHTVINCNSNGRTESAELAEGARKANEGKVDYFISLHMNSFNGKAYGTEAYVYSENSRAKGIAERLVNNFATLGFYNRGVKYNAKYYEMKNIDAPNIIFETLFCDSGKDVAIWSATPYEKMAYLISNAIDSSIPKNIDNQAGQMESKDEIKENETYYRVVVGSYKDKRNAEKLIKELKDKGYSAFIDIYNKLKI